MDKTYELIFCIVNAGFSGTVMDAARSAGATGGTRLRGRGSAGKEAEDFFHIQIEPEKEIVMILAPAEIKDAIKKQGLPPPVRASFSPCRSRVPPGSPRCTKSPKRIKTDLFYSASTIR